ncbi:UNVERIFIED_ORG: hypothetical protein ABIB21_001371 [Arthrobacter sp. UYEF13]
MQGRKSLKPDMFVGSGTVEAGCNAIVGPRLKLSGMRWSGLQHSCVESWVRDKSQPGLSVD